MARAAATRRLAKLLPAAFVRRTLDRARLCASYAPTKSARQVTFRRARSRPEPRIPNLQVHGRGTAALCNVDTHVHAEFAGELVTETNAACADSLRCVERTVRRATRANASKADNAPASIKLPAGFELERCGGVSLVAHCGHAAQLYVRTQEERRAGRRPRVICACAKRDGRRRRPPADQHLLEALEIVGSAECFAREQHGTLRVDSARRREDVVPRIELEHRGRRRDLDARAIDKTGECGLVAKLWIYVGIHEAQPCGPRGLRRELPVGLRDDPREVKRIADLLIQRRAVGAEAVEIEIHLSGTATDDRAQTIVEPATCITGECAARSVFRRKSTDSRQVGTRETLVTRFMARPDEHGCATAAIANGRFGDDERDRQETARVLEKVAEVELPVIMIGESRASHAFSCMWHRFRHGLSLGCRLGDRV